MGRKHPIAAIYMLTDTTNGKVYIGETANFVDRMSWYKSTPNRKPQYNTRPICQAILDHGFDTFVPTLLVSSKDDPKLSDTVYRTKLEAEYIEKYKATNPEYGYNVEDTTYRTKRNGKRKGVKTSVETRMLKSDIIFVYDKDTEFVTMYFGKKAFADYIGKDRSIVARCAKNGKATSHYYVFEADYETRYKNAVDIISKKIYASGYDTTGKAKKTLKAYTKALRAVNEFCEECGYKAVDVDEIIYSCED